MDNVVIWNRLGLTDHVCAYCGSNGGGYLEIEHIIPHAHGGRDHPDNYVLCCYDCNRKKRDRTPEQADMAIRYGRSNLRRVK